MDGHFQIILTIIIAFVITAILGPVTIPILHKIKAGQSIREEGPKAHQVKAGTPTMGGIMIILAVIITCVTIGHGLNADMGILLLSFALCGLIGFCDDFIKVVKKRNLGLTALQKLIFQIIIAIIIAVYQAKVSVYGTSVYIPIWKNYIDLGWFYIPFIAFVLVAAVNAVNLTDGLDGLASGCTAIVALFFAIVGNATGALATAAVMMNIEMILPLAGGIFVVEVLSVIIQVVSFKTRGKRVFKMAPLHHHFELSGWKETKVVAVFWTITLILCVLSMLIL